MFEKKIYPLASWVIALLVPLAVIMLSARLLMTPLFVEVEYRMPGFPNDYYGFTLQDRIQWAKPSVEYLVNGAGINFLADLQFEDGQAIYNERELSHMHDVKLVVQMLVRVWLVDLLVLVLLGVLARRGGWWNKYLLGIKRGGMLTLGLLVSLGVFASISFWQFFAWFHSLFFSGDSWIFEYSDTLIRLFPLRFWQDAVIFIVVFSVIVSFLLGFKLKPAEN